MKTRNSPGHRQFELKLLGYGNCYYIERVVRLEAALARKPRLLQINLIGTGEIPADAALLIRSLLLARSPKTQVITNARSSLHNGSVLVWLLGDRRLIRDDARVFFRRATLPDEDVSKPDKWSDDEPEFCDSYSEIDPGEGDHACVLHYINEFLPVRELAGRLIEMPVLRQFGLVENEKVDHFLATAFGAKREPPNRSHAETRENRPVVRGLKARQVIAQGKRPNASAALGNPSQNKSSPVGAKEKLTKSTPYECESAHSRSQARKRPSRAVLS